MPRVVLAALVGGDALARRRDVSGRVPQPARRPVPARGRGRRGARSDDRHRVPARGVRRQRVLPAAAFVGGSWRSGSRTRSAARRSASADAATLVLAGVTVAAFFTAWQTFVQQQNAETLQEVYSWILGNIPSTGWSDVRADPAVRRRRGGGHPRSAARRSTCSASATTRPQASASTSGACGCARRRGDARHCGRRRGERADRLRRDHRPARRPPPLGRRLPRAAPAVARHRRGLPRARRRDRAHRALARPRSRSAS